MAGIGHTFASDTLMAGAGGNMEGGCAARRK